MDCYRVDIQLLQSQVGMFEVVGGKPRLPTSALNLEELAAGDYITFDRDVVRDEKGMPVIIGGNLLLSKGSKGHFNIEADGLDRLEVMGHLLPLVGKGFGAWKSLKLPQIDMQLTLV